MRDKMSYRYRTLNAYRSYSDRYDSAGYERTWSSGRRGGWGDAYAADGGANDEGYNYRQCRCCRKVTEHDLTECLACGTDN